ncbi:unnamed protein product [Nesidiocoris tenuis]|uniref:Endocuticle structural glycoprotein SgAbd-2 n=1 Tax=Nesidiocoris tenuis TaxID=355587 RepID=A0A6H5HKA1_9HEMI|nr:unnamed protein product [Nesidiocoris tenuis]
MKTLLATLTLWTVSQAQNYQPQQNRRFQPTPAPAEPEYQNYPSTPQPTQLPAVDPQKFDKDPYNTPVPIIKLSKQMSLDGSYKSSYETGNSILAEESGFIKNIGEREKEGLVQFGSYSYTDPDGRIIAVKYTADEGGFRAEGDHLPTPPPVPADVQKGLDIIFESIRLRQVSTKVPMNWLKSQFCNIIQI